MTFHSIFILFLALGIGLPALAQETYSSETPSAGSEIEKWKQTGGPHKLWKKGGHWDKSPHKRHGHWDRRHSRLGKDPVEQIRSLDRQGYQPTSNTGGGVRNSSGGNSPAPVQGQNQTGGGGFRTSSAFTSFVEGLAASRQTSVSPTPTRISPTGPIRIDEPLEPLPEEPQPAPAVAGFQTPDELESAIAEDIADCKRSASSAQVCCGNPMACRNRLSGGEYQNLTSLADLLNRSPSAGGLTDYCSQLRNAADSSKDVNSGLASVCSESQGVCQSTCQDLKSEYESFLAQCSDCDAADTLRTAVQMLESTGRSCQGLTVKSDAMNGNGLEAAAAQMAATHCKGVTTAQSNAGPGFTPPPALNEKLGSPVTLDEGGRPVKSGSIESGPRMDMRVDASQGFKGYSGSPSLRTQQPVGGTQAPRASVGGTGAPRGLGSNGGSVGGAATYAKTAGDRKPASEGASASDRTPAEKNDVKGEKVSVTEGATPPPTPINGNGDQFDSEQGLEKYLSRGVRVAMKRMAHTKEINAKEVNIFMRVSAKLQEKCRLGVLWQCD